MKYITIRGQKIPAIGLGTWQLKGKEGKIAIKTALDLGYRHIDTAQMYNNESEVGEAIADHEIPRDEIFVTTKLDRMNLRYDTVSSSFKESLERLSMDYVDLLLIHWPSETVPLEETLNAMNELRNAGKVEHIGVSNFSVELMKKAQKYSEAPIFCNQVEYHPFYSQKEIISYCQNNEIVCTAYSPLAKGRAINNKTLTEIGKKYGKTAAQITLRWHIQQENVIPIPKASSRRHLKENIDIFNFTLSEKDMGRIFQLEKGMKLI